MNTKKRSMRTASTMPDGIARIVDVRERVVAVALCEERKVGRLRLLQEEAGVWWLAQKLKLMWIFP